MKDTPFDHHADMRGQFINRSFARDELHYRLEQPIEPFMRSAKITSEFDSMRHRIQVDLQMQVIKELARNVEVSVHRSWPSTWWDAFKERWFPQRLLNWFPVRYDRCDIEICEPVYSICPHLPEVHKHGQCVQFVVNPQDKRWNTLKPTGFRCFGRELYVDVPADRTYMADRVKQKLADIFCQLYDPDLFRNSE